MLRFGPHSLGMGSYGAYIVSGRDVKSPRILGISNTVAVLRAN
jgi:hypothetical protein